MKAIVIDDSKTMRAILRSALGDAGFDVLEAADGREGLERLAEAGPVDLALVDWNMPVLDGIEFVRAVRADPSRKKMIVMMVTTESEMAHVQRALEQGADEYLMKPFTRDALREKLDLLGMGSGR